MSSNVIIGYSRKKDGPFNQTHPFILKNPIILAAFTTTSPCGKEPLHIGWHRGNWSPAFYRHPT